MVVEPIGPKKQKPKLPWIAVLLRLYSCCGLAFDSRYCADISAVDCKNPEVMMGTRKGFLSTKERYHFKKAIIIQNGLQKMI